MSDTAVHGPTAEAMQAWTSAMSASYVLLENTPAGPEWLTSLQALGERIRTMLNRNTDLGLYLMHRRAGAETRHYSAHHGVFTAAVTDLCARWLGWPESECNAAFFAALSMNIAMGPLQDKLAEQLQGPDAEQRKCIDEHPALSARLLSDAGVSDALWLEVVRRHHNPFAAGEDTAAPSPAQRIAMLVQRIDVFTAKLSRRRSREGFVSTKAARDACFGATGAIDEIGATLIRVLGLYPPGSLVGLAGGESAIVVRRGNKAHSPLVVVIRRADGGIPPLRLRDTGDPAFRVTQVFETAALRVRIADEAVLATR